MLQTIKRYPVKHPLLQKYIKFFWEVDVEHIKMNHRIIPVRNIDLKFNLTDTPNYLVVKGKEQLLEEVYFSGLQDHYREARLQMNGRIHMLGICFFPEGFYPFLKIPLSEIKNELLGAETVGFRQAISIREKLTGATSVDHRLDILEQELLSLHGEDIETPETFRQIFYALIHRTQSVDIASFCRRHNITPRTLERMCNKYVGLSAKTYKTLHRFQNSVNQIFYGNYSKLSDVAYENGFFDQMHFIRDFKRFSGNAPRSFLQQNNSMLHIGKIT